MHGRWKMITEANGRQKPNHKKTMLLNPFSPAIFPVLLREISRFLSPVFE